MVATTIRAAWLHALNRPREAPRRFWLAAKALWLSRHDQAQTIQSRWRWQACQRCELFDPKWGACGDGKKKLSDGSLVGCLCWMKRKVTIPTATCWLHDQGVTDQGVTDQGWPK